MPLTDTKIKSLGPGTALYRVADEKGLCIEVPPVGARRWRVRYRFGQKAGMLSVGTYPEVSLKQARARRDEIRRQIEQGIDPSAAREAAKDALAGEGSFDALAREWYHQYTPGWNPAHASRIWRRLEVDLLPWLGKRPVQQLEAPELLACLRRIQARGALETAHRALQTLSLVFPAMALPPAAPSAIPSPIYAARCHRSGSSTSPRSPTRRPSARCCAIWTVTRGRS